MRSMPMDVSCVALFVSAAIFLCLALHPFVIYPLSLLLIRHFLLIRRPLLPSPPQTSDAEVGVSRYAICMCAYNEEAVIRDKMWNLLALAERLGPTEILVFVDGSSDGTSRIL